MSNSPTTAKTVADAREAFASVRTMKRNVRLGRYEGRNNGGDHTFPERRAWELVATLPRQLQGHLTAEHGLAERLSYARDHHQERPELKARLNAHRRLIKELLS